VVVGPRDPDAPRTFVYGALVTVQVLFGLHYLASKVVLREIPPALWALMRVASAALLLLLIARWLGRRLPRSGKDLARLALYSIFGVLINQLCFVEGLSRTTPSHAAILMTAIPVGTLLFAIVLRREHLTAAKAASFALALGGVLLVLKPSAAELAGASLAGDLLVVANALSFSLFLVISKPVLERVEPVAATAVLMSFGALGMVVPGLMAVDGFSPAAVSGTTWALGAFIVVFPTALAYLLNFWALARVESSLVAFFIYLQPLIATGLSVAFLDDRLDREMVGGAALIFLAVFLALRPERRAPRPAAAEAE